MLALIQVEVCVRSTFITKVRTYSKVHLEGTYAVPVERRYDRNSKRYELEYRERTGETYSMSPERAAEHKWFSL